MSKSISGPAAGPQVRRRARPARHRTQRGKTTALAVLFAVITLSSGCGGGAPAPAGPPATRADPAAAAPDPPAAADPAAVTDGAGSTTGSLIATARKPEIAVRNRPDGKIRRKLANPNSIGGPLTFMVLKSEPRWLQVALPMRPNGASGWIARSDVDVTGTTYRLVISRSKHRLDVMHDGRRTARYPVGVGKSATPTPPGTYYLTELIRPPNPKGDYGPYAFGLSAYSNTLKSFAGGPGQLGLHGTDVPEGLGTDISHGCLRVENSVITELAGVLPLGTPVEIRT